MEVPVEDEGWAKLDCVLGDCYYKKREFHQAIDSYSSLLSSPAVSKVILNDAIRNIGYAYYDLGELSEAISHLQKVEDAYDAYPELKTELLTLLSSARSRLGGSSLIQ
jgi:tetratricopeptide (TPR) repeat protein